MAKIEVIKENPYVLKFVLRGELEMMGKISDSTQQFMLNHGMIDEPITRCEAEEILRAVA